MNSLLEIGVRVVCDVRLTWAFGRSRLHSVRRQEADCGINSSQADDAIWRPAWLPVGHDSAGLGGRPSGMASLRNSCRDVSAAPVSGAQIWRIQRSCYARTKRVKE